MRLEKEGKVETKEMKEGRKEREKKEGKMMEGGKEGWKDIQLRARVSK
jgi:hypothetical protein